MERVNVALKVRPLSRREISEGRKEIISFNASNTVILDGKLFDYDYVFGPNSSQLEIFNSAVLPLLRRYFEGCNGTIFAYGQTGSGKTYSMGTEATMCDESSEERGVIPRLITTVFDWIDQKKDTSEFRLSATFLEVCYIIGDKLIRVFYNNFKTI